MGFLCIVLGWLLFDVLMTMGGRKKDGFIGYNCLK